MRRELQVGAGVRAGRWVAWALLPLASTASAQIAVLDCGSGADKPMVVRYYDGEAPKFARGPEVAFKALVRPRTCPDSGPCEASAELLRKELSCRKPQGLFVFQFKPVPFSPNLQGMCGGNVTGHVTVLRDGRQVLPSTLFEDPAACFDNRADALKVRSITISPAGGRPVIDRVPVR